MDLVDSVPGRLALALAAATLAWPLPLLASDEWALKVESGDTLQAIAKRFLRTPNDWRSLQQHNKVTNPDRITPGLELRIPVEWMRTEASSAQVLQVQGQALAGAEGAAEPAMTAVVAGQVLPPGTRLRTGPDGAVSLRFVDGSEVLVTPRTDTTLEQMHRVPATGLTRTQLQLRSGAVESTVRPQAEGQRSFQIRTPVVMLGVRGTRFRAALDAATAAGASRLEVLEGSVQADARGSAELGAGQGVVTATDGRLGPVETLLPAPELPAPAPGPLSTLAWTPLAGAASYHTQLFALSSTARLVHDARWPGPAARWDGVPDGVYRLRVRAVAASGLEGADAESPIEIAAPRPVPAGPPPPRYALPPEHQQVTGSGVTLSWYRTRVGDRYRVQLARSADFASPLLDQAGADPDPYTLQQLWVSLPPGRYHWRVARIGEGTSPGPFGPTRSFELLAVP